ncbi:carbohydrate ABC transporter permease [Horticoccus luteus]|uniref:Carbohydrate ABC transporter permease n=1 Tax=Horticoccus luteus TaxID=2862869 RepID=A0A8F9XLF5_9BACT|nr:carbohydrate ABC transporter permease [Horticoccus luteus]QYM79166.1 carbohydrate ABC transporter permease [Horticoccus luteus]
MAAPRSTAAFRYALLLLAGGVFLTPFVWLVATSLKPIEQAMTLPPQLLPRAYYAVIAGVRMEVTKDYPLPTAGVVVEMTKGAQAGRQLFLSAPEAAAQRDRLKILHRTEVGWWRVTERFDVDLGAAVPRWDIVAPAALEEHVHFRWSNYPRALAAMGGQTADQPTPAEAKSNVPFSRFLVNTLLVAGLGALGTVFSNAIVAYGFARLQWRGRDAFFAITLATMMVPFPVLMVPLYGVFRELHWVGTLLPLWVPAWFGSAFNIFLMRQFFLNIPEELSEAARIDGSSEWSIFWRIILPLSKPVLATAALFHFLYAWNDFLGPLLYLTRRETFTLSLALQAYQSQSGGTQWPYLMAASVVTTLPIIVLFFFAQRFFIQGIATTGSKG